MQLRNVWHTKTWRAQPLPGPTTTVKHPESDARVDGDQHSAWVPQALEARLGGCTALSPGVVSQLLAP